MPDIIRSSDTEGETPPEPTFTGDVRVFGWTAREAPSRLLGATTHYAAVARSPWKTNPAGQTLVVTQGSGWVQVEGEAPVQVVPGDVVWCPPLRAHWDGAGPDGSLTCAAFHEIGVSFGDAVTQEHYDAAVASTGGPR